jgi:hypothetical protein
MHSEQNTKPPISTITGIPESTGFCGAKVAAKKKS